MTESEFQKQLKKYHKTGEMPVELAVKLLSECTTDGVYDDETEEAKFMAIQALEQEPREITLEDVKEYCKPRCLSIITNELLYELTHPKISALEQEPRKGEWLRMSDLSEQEDDRYKCSHCGNVIHHKNKMDLYTFNSWCGRCGSDNGRHINYEVEE